MSKQEVGVHFAYVEQQRLDTVDRTALHAAKRKIAFDWKVLISKAGPVEFESSQLVQVYNNAADTTFATNRKLMPRWSAPCCVVGKVSNSYRLATLEGFPISEMVHARWLQHFFPREGTVLAQMEEDRVGGEDEDGSREGERREERASKWGADRESDEVEDEEGGLQDG